MLGFELAMLKARGKIDSSAGKDFLEAEGLLCPGEWQALIDGDRHTTVFWWIQVRSKAFPAFCAPKDCTTHCL